MMTTQSKRVSGQATLHLYYSDTTLSEFIAVIKATDNSMEQPRVQLDQTAFYPTSGGQPHDTGTLNGVRVIDVIEDDAGAIWHILEKPLPSETLQVHGRIDWSRRFDHMQQHTGQHLLSAACENIISAPTVGFHMGNEASTIDLELPSGHELDWDTLFTVEQAVNQAIWEDRPVAIRIMNEKEIATVALRKPPAVTGRIRVIDIPGYDASACGGTHVAATGQIGLVKVVGFERYRGGVRITFLAGKRALLHYQHHLHLLLTSSRALSVGPEELPQAIARLEEGAKETRRALHQMREELLTFEADRLWAKASVINSLHVIAVRLTGRTFAEARSLAGSLRIRPATIILFAVPEGEMTRFICARSDGITDPSAAALLQEILNALGGRGGGSNSMAQGGAPAQPAEKIDEALQETLRRHQLA